MKAVQHWKCEICKAHNDVLNVICWSCKSDKPDWITSLYQMRVEIDRGIFDSYGILSSYFPKNERRAEGKLMTPNEELHAKFFSEEAVLVVSMDDVDLDEHIQELEAIAREAKARMLAAVTEKKNRADKAGTKKWKVEPIGPDPSVTDSLNKVKQRSARMGKLDKMRDKMAILGIPESEIEQMLSKMVSLARKEPEALRAEAKLKESLTKNQEPSIVTEEERIRRILARKELDDKDKAQEKAEKEQAKALKEAMEKEAEKNKAPVHSSKDEKIILTEDEPAHKPTTAEELWKAMQAAAKTQAKKEST